MHERTAPGVTIPRAASGTPVPRSWWAGVRNRLEGRAFAVAWALLVANVLIVGTGGAVRLTASGLGCPTWPMCTEESLVATPEMGIHGVIEFGNRLLTFVLVLVAAAAFLSVIRRRSARPDLFRLTVSIGIGIIVQAGVGGVTVLLDLHPGAVGVHYMLSALLVSLSATLVFRVSRGPAGARTVSGPVAFLVWTLTGLTVVTVYLGTLTTGAGPHAGDRSAARNGLDPGLLQHFHAWPSYAMLALTLGLTAVAFRRADAAVMKTPILVLLGCEIVQMLLGIAQARLGLPIGLVGGHMVMACVLIAALTWTVNATRQPPPVAAGTEHPA